MLKVIYSGRPLTIADDLDQVDAVVAAWLPGPEGLGISDVLFGDYPFTGKTPLTWPVSLEGYHGLPLDPKNVLFPYGFGLKTL
jgi:beta-glucosidase